MNLFLHVVPTTLDLLFIVACVGLVATELWVIPRGARKGTMSPFYSLWRLLGLMLAGLTLVSMIGLFQRTVEMSGLPLGEAFSAVPLALSKTHYGMTWLVRMAGVSILWLGWWLIKKETSKKGDSLLSYSVKSETVPFLLKPSPFLYAMLLAASSVVWSVSASSHAADWGDFTLPEWMSWLHIMAGSLWVGGMLAFMFVVRRHFRKRSEHSRVLFAAYASRLSRLAGVALVLVLATGAYNVWRQMDHFSDLWASGYGRIILFKLVLVAIMAMLGALSRYFGLPFLCKEAGVPLASRQTSLPLQIWKQWHPSWKPREGDALVRQFRRRVTVEVWLALGVLVCAAFLGHAMPPKKHADAVQHVTILDAGKYPDFRSGSCLT